MLPLVGKLGEQFGQMRVFSSASFVFTLGSLLCGLAPNIYVLIACRVLQALGGGGFMPSATAIVAREFPETRSRMIGLFASIFPLGGILGPNLGGYIIQHFGWREVFLVNVPDRHHRRADADLADAGGRPAPPGAAAERATPSQHRRARHAAVRGAIVSLLLALTMLGDDPDLDQVAAVLAAARRRASCCSCCSSGRSAAPSSRSSN